MTKQGVKGKYPRTLNEKYEMYLYNSMRRIINTNTHNIKSTNYNTVQVIQQSHGLGWDNYSLLWSTWYKNSVVLIIILMPSEQDLKSHWFNGAQLYVATSDSTPGGFFPIKFESHKRLISTWVLCNKKWLR